MILYLVAGACFAPAGLIYALLVLSHHESTLAALLLLAATCIPAMFAWDSWEKRLFPPQHVPQFVLNRISAQVTARMLRPDAPFDQAVASRYYVAIITSAVAETHWNIGGLVSGGSNLSSAPGKFTFRLFADDRAARVPLEAHQ
jgi:hypothetical protein